MLEASIELSVVHADIDDKERAIQLEKFKSGLTKILVTTDVFGRGMDVVALDVVIN